MDAAQREFDLVLAGATGFVGRLTAEYLAKAAPAGTRIALAGRSAAKLDALRADLGETAVTWPVIVVDSNDEEGLRELAWRTMAVATTIGPYAKYGLPLVLACAAAGTHYADLTGEVLFVRDSIDAAHRLAVRSGARIVHACGFDAVPSDLAVLLAARAAADDAAGELAETTMVVESLRGGLSGGTIDSMRGMVDQARSDPARRRVLLDPYSLDPIGRSPAGGERDSLALKRFDGRWVAPFVMASFNTRVVRRSNALTGYGKDFHYREVMSVGRSPLAPVLAAAVATGIGGLLGGLALAPTRAVLDRVLPKPGQGPSPKARAKGHFRIETTATTTGGARYRATVGAVGDPGYAATAVMFGEAALSLALDEDRLPPAAGVLTPATGVGEVLVERLRGAGFTVACTAVDTPSRYVPWPDDVERSRAPFSNHR